VVPNLQTPLSLFFSDLPARSRAANRLICQLRTFHLHIVQVLLILGDVRLVHNLLNDYLIGMKAEEIHEQRGV
jgi:hypothetical protein